MPSLPTPGDPATSGVWGVEMNQFLNVAHNVDGTLNQLAVESTSRGNSPEQLALMTNNLNANGHQITNLDISNLGIGGNSFFGDGSDGAAICDGTIVPPGMNFAFGFYSLQRDVFYTNLTVMASVSINTNGYKLFCGGTTSLAPGSQIFNVGNVGGNTGAGGTGGFGGTLAPGTLGATGTTGGGSRQAAGFTLSLGLSGLSSGSGGASSIHSFTLGSTLTNPQSEPRSIMNLVNFMSWSASNSQVISGGDGGASGAGDGTNAGGGGGGGGGIIVLFSRFITGTGSILAYGGNGGSPAATTCGGGGGGEGGSIGICSSSIVSGAIPGITLNVAGGLGSTGTRTGGAGNGSVGAAGKTILLAP